MWRKQGEQKASTPATDFAARPAPERPPSPVEPRREGSRVSKALTVKGEISGREDLLIDGEVQGSIRLTEAGVTVGPNGKVTADIDAQDIVVHGSVKGNLRGHDRVEIGRSGSVTGEVVTHRIIIEEGALFHGSIDVVQPEEARPARAAGAAAGTGTLPAVAFGAKEPQ